jgi:hypothetical protein
MGFCHDGPWNWSTTLARRGWCGKLSHTLVWCREPSTPNSRLGGSSCNPDIGHRSSLPPVFVHTALWVSRSGSTRCISPSVAACLPSSSCSHRRQPVDWECRGHNSCVCHYPVASPRFYAVPIVSPLRVGLWFSVLAHRDEKLLRK